MKKILALTSLLALAACGISQEEIAKHDADFMGCERVDTNKMHLVYKCPTDMEWIKAMKQKEPNALFMTGRNLNWDNINADTEHTYVEVVLGMSAGCADKFHYRVMVKPFNLETREYFAVEGCK